jgi:uncharacterized protein YhaN
METDGIQIKSIRVNREGPLKNDFELKPEDINLVYGHNETGKSYVVEAIINILFRTGRKSTVDWRLRDWGSAGSISVSGLNDKPVTFKRTGKKLEDYWGGETGLPRDLSRLLVVKEGETLLAEEKDGVGRDILKNYLSGVGLLDTIESRISSTLKKAKVSGKKILGSQTGEIKQRKDLENSRAKLTELFEDVEDAYTSGVSHDLEQKRDNITEEIEGLEKAKRYHACCLQTELDSLNQEKKRLPDQMALVRISGDIAAYETQKKNFKDVTTEIKGLGRAGKDYGWVENALKVYREISGEKSAAHPKLVYAVLALILFAGVVVTGLLNLPIPMIICAAGALAFSIFYAIGMRRSLALVVTNQELEKLKEEFKKRFGSELTDRAVLEAKVEELRKDHSHYEILTENLKALDSDIEKKESSIRGDLERFTGKSVPPPRWHSTIENLRKRLDELTDKINSLNNELNLLDVPEAEFLHQDPGIKWDAERYKDLKEELSKTSKVLDAELAKLETLKARVAQATSSSSTDWEKLISALRDKREEVGEEYRLITAEILAKIVVNAIIQKLRQEENKMIASGLERKELTEPLHAITGCYKCMRYDEKDGLIVINDNDEEYPLETLSTGAKEQTFLAMRMGFASIVMEGRTAFLILDDAFQHSDWPRRTNLMGQVSQLVESGWQVFYFTMDDHIKDLFLKEGEKVGSRFKSLELR